MPLEVFCGLLLPIVAEARSANAKRAGLGELSQRGLLREATSLKPAESSKAEGCHPTATC
jgi:hypothetical protein